MDYYLSPEDRAKHMGRGFKAFIKRLDRVNRNCEYILAICNTLTGSNPEQVSAFLEAEEKRVLELNQKTIIAGFRKMGLKMEILSNDGLNMEVELFSRKRGSLHTTVRIDILTSGDAYKDWMDSLLADYPHLFGEQA